MADHQGPWSGLQPPDPPRRRPRLGLYVWLGLLAAVGAFVLILARLVPGQLQDDDGFEALRLMGVLAVVTSGLVAARRIDLRGAARGAAWWVAILLILVLGYAYRDDMADAALRLRGALFPSLAVNSAPRTVVVGRSLGGGFYVLGQVNGAPVLFLIDTGASDIVLAPQDAARAGVGDTGPDQASETANGVGHGATATVRSLTVGPIRLSDVPVTVNRAPISVSLLGMPFLRRLASFEAKGDQLVLRGKP